MADVAEPAFTVEREEGAFQVRRYEPMIVASVTVDGERGTAANRGFRLLADYIFGNNTGGKIAMTAPVMQSPGETIAMTAPVMQEPAAGEDWTVSFVMPASYTMETLPRPNNEAVRIEERPGRTVAAIRFAGLNTRARLARNTRELAAWVEANGLEPAGPHEFAFYDPPWTPPFLRRNEVLIPIAKPADG